MIFFFFGFYLLSILQLYGGCLSAYLINSDLSMGINSIWKIAVPLNRIRFIFLILFTLNLHRFSGSIILTGFFIFIAMAGILFPFFVYSIIPEISEIVIMLYVFLYWNFVYLKRNKVKLSDRKVKLLRSILVCSGFFFIGLVLDLLGRIPQSSVYISLININFFPWYMAAIGVIFSVWAVQDIRLANQTAPSEKEMEIPFPDITKREREIVNLILQGQTNNSIADTLFISESTVKKHINNIFKKLQISSRWELLKWKEKIHLK